MIGYLKGKVIKKTHTMLITVVNGVGYRVNVLPQTIANTSEKDIVELFIHNYVREDEISLYGFEKFKQLETFELLISIAGIGPKLAFNILSTTTPAELRAAVVKTDISVLSRIPGIGTKSASKIMLELSNKLAIDQPVDRIIFSPGDEMAVEALKNLGFKANEARQAIHKAGRSYDKLEDKIRAGLRYLNKWLTWK